MQIFNWITLNIIFVANIQLSLSNSIEYTLNIEGCFQNVNETENGKIIHNVISYIMKLNNTSKSYIINIENIEKSENQNHNLRDNILNDKCV